jgi:hypothetical protein
MPKLYENYIGNTDYDAINDMIEKANLWQSFCVKDQQTPIISNKKGGFMGFQDKNGAKPILRCPSWFETADVTEELCEFLKQFKDLNFNIIKIQKYIKNVEGIAPHSDKCIDMDEESIYIYRVCKDKDKCRSLYFCEKENKKNIQEFKLKNDSLIEISYEENKRLLHWVPKENSDEISDECISFVLRKSHTFRLKTGEIYGKGAKYKTFEERMDKKSIDYNKIIDLRNNFSNTKKMYNIENKTNLNNKCDVYDEICKKIIEQTI